jgi:hypothetical protein
MRSYIATNAQLKVLWDSREGEREPIAGAMGVHFQVPRPCANDSWRKTTPGIGGFHDQGRKTVYKSRRLQRVDWSIDGSWLAQNKYKLCRTTWELDASWPILYDLRHLNNYGLNYYDRKKSLESHKKKLGFGSNFYRLKMFSVEFQYTTSTCDIFVRHGWSHHSRLKSAEFIVLWVFWVKFFIV